MTFPQFPLSMMPWVRMLPLAAAGWLLGSGTVTQAATIGIGNVTTALGPMFYVDDAVVGGGDATITQPTVQSFTRSFAGLLSANQGQTQVVLNGFGFATSAAAASNTATSLTVTFTYLGADEAVGGGDDVILGSATGTYTYTGGGEYVFPFDTPITASLNITGTKFRIQVAPSKTGGGGAVLFKTGPLTYETATGSKLSVSGFVARRVNLAKQQATVTDSVNGVRVATYLTDGFAGNESRWESSGAAPHWAQVVFPFPVQVGSAHVYSGVDDAGALTSFQIQYFNGSAWLDAPGGAISGNTDVEQNVVFTAPVTASSFRIYDSADATMSVREFALYSPNGTSGFPIGTDVTVNLAQQRPALASANTAGNFPLLAVDGKVNQASKWQTSTAGAQWLEIDLRQSMKIGSAHLYSGLPGVAALSDFVLRYWDGAAWQAVPGGSVTGNASAARVINFTSAVTASKVRLEFTNTGTVSVQELCVFPANNSGGYPIGTGIFGAPPVTATPEDFSDSFYRITNATAARYIAVNAGVPGLSQTGLTTAQGQYQILLNVGAGTYRLLNRATGECLSGAQLSTTPGAALVDAPYSALPDQDWILDAIDGTNFFLVNQWSGLVLDTQGGGTAAGTPLVQSVNSGANSQRWQLVYNTHAPKKGVGGDNFATPYRANWMYNWGASNSVSLPDGVLYNPMQWSDHSPNPTVTQNLIWKLASTWRATGNSIHLMGYNEPDHTDQANMTVAEGVAYWPRLLALDMPLVGPCPASVFGGWMSDFYTQADALGYRVDYTPKHTYGSPQGGNSDVLVNDMQTAYTTWGRPIWLTEFSFVDYSGTGTWTEEDNYNCLAEFLWRAESISWLRKYALFVFTEDASHPAPAQPWSTVGPRSNARDAAGKFTAFGELYAAWDGVAQVAGNKTYLVHHKGTRKRLANILNAAPAGRSIRTSDESVNWTLVPKGSGNLYYLTSSRDGRRLRYDSIADAVSFAAAGTIGADVEWQLTETAYGWYYLGNPATSKRLKLVYNNSTFVSAYSMVTTATTDDSVQWRFIVPLPARSWSGTISTSWGTAGNWLPSGTPMPDETVTFNTASTANLATVLNQIFSVAGVEVTTPTGNISIGGAQTLSIGTYGIDLSASTRNLTLTAPVALGAAQTWRVASGRTLAVNGGVAGSFGLNINGAGKTTLGGAASHSGDMTIELGGTLQMSAVNVLPSGAGEGDMVVDGLLNLNGFSQSLNGLSGSGVVDNATGSGARILTVGSSNSTSTFDGTLQNTSGTLALLKIGSGNLTLTGNNTHSGGTTKDGTGSLNPKTDTAFGTGPVVVNGGTLYATGGAYTFANALSLGGGTVRVGGGTSSSVTWTGPVSVTADAGISADGSTLGVTISGNLNNAGFTLTSYGNGVTNNLSGVVRGSGAISVTGGTLNLNAANTFSGTYRAAAGTLRIYDGGAMQNATLDMNPADAGAVSMNGLNATIGALTGSRNLSLGTGIISIGNNNQSTSYSGVLSSSGSLVKTGSGTLTLSGANSHTGGTTVNGGTLSLGASNSFPGNMTIGNGILDAATFTDTIGTLDITGTARINVDTGGKFAFAASNAVIWTGGTLTVTGTFVSGSSLRFGTSSSGLDATQRALITIVGFTNVGINSSGYLTASPLPSYTTWASTNAPTGSVQDDFDSDGVSNGIEYVLGGSKNTNDRGKLPQLSITGGNFVFSFQRAQSSIDGSTTVAIDVGTAVGAWPTSYAVPAGAVANNPGVSVVKNSAPGFDTVTLTLPLSSNIRMFARLKVTP